MNPRAAAALGRSLVLAAVGSLGPIVGAQDPQPAQQPPQGTPPDATAATPPQATAPQAPPSAPLPNAPQVPEPPPDPREPKGERLPLSLERAVEIALENDLGLSIESISTDVARYNYAGSWGAFDPLLTANAAVSDSEFQGTSSLSGGVVLEENTQEFSTALAFPLTTGGNFSLGFNTVNEETNNVFQLVNPSTSDSFIARFHQPLLRGAWRDYATSQQQEAELVYHQSLELYRQRRQELIHTVHRAYWDLVAALEQLGVADATLNLGREQLDQNKRRLDAGVGTEVEVLQAETNVAQRIEQRLLALVTVYGADDALKAVLFPGIDKRTWEIQITPATALPESTDWPVPPWESALMVAIEQRPELRVQRMEVDISEVRLVRATSERRVGLDLNLSSTSRSIDGDPNDAFQSAVGWDFPSNRAELALSAPLGNRTAKNAERAARALTRESRLVYDQRESEIAAEVRAAIRQIIYSTQAAKAAMSSLDLARRQLAAEEARFREGLSTTFQVLEFQQQLAEALSSERRARVVYVKARVALDKAEGVLGEIETASAAAPPR
jgi:outer membrane protein TolC